jgi:hypothetical protein
MLDFLRYVHGKTQVIIILHLEIHIHWYASMLTRTDSTIKYVYDGITIAFLFIHFIPTGRLSFNLSRYIIQPCFNAMATAARKADSFLIVVTGILI